MSVGLSRNRWMTAMAALATAILVLAVTGPATAADVSYSCTTPPVGYPTLQLFISGDPAAGPPLPPGVSSGDTILLEGNCVEDISLIYPLNITAVTAGVDGITGTGTGSVITVGAGANPVALTDLTITGGVSVTGAAINNAGNLTLTGVTVDGNDATGGSGGGVLNGFTGSLTVNAGTTISNNVADFGGGIQNLGQLTVNAGSIETNDALGGGGVNNAGTMTVAGGTFLANTANEGAGILNGASLTVSGGTFDSNAAVANGGGIYVGSGATTTNVALALFDGNTAVQGAGFYNNSTSVLDSTTFSNNRATDDPTGIAETTGNGGAIANHATLTVTGNTIIDTNSAVTSGGAVYIAGGDTTLTSAIVSTNDAPSGGGIQLDGGTLTLNGNAAVSQNTANNGAGISAASGTVSIIGGTIDSNVASNKGGAIFIFDSSVSADGTAFELNSAVSEAGGVFVDPTSTFDVSNAIFDGNNTTGSLLLEPADGGAIHTLGTTSIEGTVFDSNSAADGVGGAVYNAGAASISTSTFTNNSVANGGSGPVAGGALYNIGEVSIDSSTFNGNNAPSFGGGAIYNVFDAASLETSGVANITNSTITGNTSSNGGGIANNSGATLDIVSSTIAGNTAVNSGGGIWNDDTTSSSVTMTGSILADNISVFTLECNGTIDSGGYNIVGAEPFIGFCFFNSTVGDQVGTTGSPIDPMLLALADNGGPTQTMAPDTGSPAIDAIPAASCSVSIDQAGNTRPDGLGCEIGALEILSDDPPVAVDDVASVLTPGGNVSIPVTANDIEPEDQTLSGLVVATPPTNGTAVVSGLNITYTHNGGAATSDSFTYTVTDGTNTSNAATVTINVGPANLAPIAVDDAASVVTQQNVVINVTDNDSDPEGGPLSNVTIVTSPTVGEATVVGLDRSLYSARN